MEARVTQQEVRSGVRPRGTTSRGGHDLGTDLEVVRGDLKLDLRFLFWERRAERRNEKPVEEGRTLRGSAILTDGTSVFLDFTFNLSVAPFS